MIVPINHKFIAFSLDNWNVDKRQELPMQETVGPYITTSSGKEGKGCVKYTCIVAIFPVSVPLSILNRFGWVKFSYKMSKYFLPITSGFEFE